MTGYRFIIVIALLTATGCGDSGPPRYQVYGHVRFQGQPVPTGTVKFLPADGNSAPASLGMIQDGEYSTPGSKGVGAGAYDVEVIGFDGVATTIEGEQLIDGQPLFAPYLTKINITPENLEHNFEIPPE